MKPDGVWKEKCFSPLHPKKQARSLAIAILFATINYLDFARVNMGHIAMSEKTGVIGGGEITKPSRQKNPPYSLKMLESC